MTSAPFDTLLATTGTSLLFKNPGFRDRTPAEAAAILEQVRDLSEGGAEYQSVRLLIESGRFVAPRHLVLLTSDTDDGRLAGDILRIVFEKHVRSCDVVPCTGLNPADPKRLVGQGLRSLVNHIVEQTRQARTTSARVAIDTTGGLKPQVAYAAVAGLLLGIPVLYRHERSEDVIELSPIPVSIDESLWYDYAWFLDPLRWEAAVPSEVPPNEPRLEPLLQRESKKVYLSPLGYILEDRINESLRLEGEDALPPPSDLDAESKAKKFEDGNANKHRGLASFVARLARVPFVTRIQEHKNTDKIPKFGRVHIPSRASVSELEVWYHDGTLTSKLIVGTTSSDRRQRLAAKRHLEEYLGDGR